MIKEIKTIILMLVIVGCKAQSPIINIEDKDGNRVQNAYYKDTNNLLDPFEGTYLYTNGTTSFTIILQKKTMVYDGYIYRDLLIGEYRYVKNGVEKVNTLNNLNIITTNHWEHNIYGNSVLIQGLPGCNDCAPNEKRLRMSLRDAVSGSWADMILGKTTVNGQEAIKIGFGWKYRLHVIGTPDLLPASIPGDDYVLIKQ